MNLAYAYLGHSSGPTVSDATDKDNFMPIRRSDYAGITPMPCNAGLISRVRHIKQWEMASTQKKQKKKSKDTTVPAHKV